jgi:hypothetical protein
MRPASYAARLNVIYARVQKNSYLVSGMQDDGFLPGSGILQPILKILIILPRPDERME